MEVGGFFNKNKLSKISIENILNLKKLSKQKFTNGVSI